MQYESSDQPDSRQEIRREGLFPIGQSSGGSTSPILPNVSVNSAYPHEAPPLPTALRKRPGCVMMAAAVLFYLGVLLLSQFGEAVTDGDTFSGFASLAMSGLLFVMSIGLLKMYRWAVHLVLIYSIIWFGEFVGRQLIWLSVINSYMTHPITKMMLFGVMAGFCLVVAILPAVVFWWFWRKRLEFAPHALVDSWGRLIYVLAAVIMMASVVSTLVDADSAVLDELEPRLKQLRELDADMYDQW